MRAYSQPFSHRKRLRYGEPMKSPWYRPWLHPKPAGHRFVCHFARQKWDGNEFAWGPGEPKICFDQRMARVRGGYAVWDRCWT